MRAPALLLLLAACSGGGGRKTPTGDAGPPGTVGGCELFPAADPWHLDVRALKADGAWTQRLAAGATKTKLHPDFGTAYGIPINVVPAGQQGVPISFGYDDQSDPGPYPFPPTVMIEGGTPTSCDGDCHVLVVQEGACLLWEAWACSYGGGRWQCGSGAKFDLSRVSVGQRPKGWTSADAAGLAIAPGLVRWDEVAAGRIDHAIRFTWHCTQDGWVAPASHQAVPPDCPKDTSALREFPPMGARIRLRDSYPTGALPEQARVVAEAMKTYGMILADNGSDYYFQGENRPEWSDEQLDALKDIPGDQLDVLEMPAIER
jgi:hypothetical protein